jgi:hypothetical protein
MTQRTDQWMKAAAAEIWDASQIDVSCREDDIDEFSKIIAEHCQRTDQQAWEAGRDAALKTIRYASIEKYGKDREQTKVDLVGEPEYIYNNGWLAGVDAVYEVIEESALQYPGVEGATAPLKELRKELRSKEDAFIEMENLLVGVRDSAICDDGSCPICLADPHSPGCVIKLVTNFVRQLDEGEVGVEGAPDAPTFTMCSADIGKIPCVVSDAQTDGGSPTEGAHTSSHGPASLETAGQSSTQDAPQAQSEDKK